MKKIYFILMLIMINNLSPFISLSHKIIPNSKTTFNTKEFIIAPNEIITTIIDTRTETNKELGFKFKLKKITLQRTSNEFKRIFSYTGVSELNNEKIKMKIVTLSHNTEILDDPISLLQKYNFFCLGYKNSANEIIFTDKIKLKETNYDLMNPDFNECFTGKNLSDLDFKKFNITNYYSFKK